MRGGGGGGLEWMLGNLGYVEGLWIEGLYGGRVGGGCF